jgi:hypothetical protein
VRAVPLAEAVEITEMRMALEGLCAAKAAEWAGHEDRAALREISERMRAAGDPVACSGLNQELHALIVTLSGQTTAGAVLERLHGQQAPPVPPRPAPRAPPDLAAAAPARHRGRVRGRCRRLRGGDAGSPGKRGDRPAPGRAGRPGVARLRPARPGRSRDHLIPRRNR